MLKKLFLFIFGLFSLLLLLLVITLGVIRFYPESLPFASSKLTDYQVSTDEIHLQLYPLQLHVENLKLSLKSGNQGKPAVELGKAVIDFDWWAKIRGKRADWIGNIEQGYVNLSTFQSKSQNGSTTSANEVEGKQRFDIHALLTLFMGGIANVRIIFDELEENYLQIKQFSANLTSDDSAQYYESRHNLAQLVEMDLVLGGTAQPLPIKGALKSFYQQGSPYLQLSLERLDLTSLVQSNEEEVTPETGAASVESGEELARSAEAEIDWSWLERLNGLNLKVSLEEMKLAKKSISEVDVSLHINDAIEIEQLNANVDWGVSEDLRFNDKVSIVGKVQPLNELTHGSDLQVELDIALSSASVHMQGELNVNGVDGTALALQMQAQKMPIGGEGLVLLEQYFPLSANADVMLSSDQVTLNLTEGQFGESDLSGEFLLSNIEANKPTIDLSLNSKNLTYVAAKVVEKNVTDAAIKSSDKLFSDEPIDWQWLHGYKVTADVQINNLDYAGVLIKNLVLPMRLDAGELALTEASAMFGGGKVDTSLSLMNDQSSSSITASIDVQDAQMDILGLFPKEQVEGGLLNINSQLSLKGNSVAQLMNSTDGYVFVDARDALIKNDSFELIGSDLLLELLSKLNPFSKADKNTKLECAITYLPVKQGQVGLDNALAIKTSKIIITGDGDIDLNKEKLNVKFTPAMRKGVGLNVGSLVKFVKLGGTLMQPKPALDAAGLLTSGLAASVALSTGGASLLADGLIGKLANDNACAQVKKNYNERNKES